MPESQLFNPNNNGCARKVYFVLKALNTNRNNYLIIKLPKSNSKCKQIPRRSIVGSESNFKMSSLKSNSVFVIQGQTHKLAILSFLHRFDFPIKLTNLMVFRNHLAKKLTLIILFLLILHQYPLPLCNFFRLILFSTFSSHEN